MGSQVLARMIRKVEVSSNLLVSMLSYWFFFHVSQMFAKVVSLFGQCQELITRMYSFIVFAERRFYKLSYF